MTSSPEQFAELLTSGIYRIRVREQKKISVIQDELGYEIGRSGGSSIEYYRKGHLPPALADVERLGAEIVRRGRLDRDWLDSFLKSAGHPNPVQVCDTLLGLEIPSTDTRGMATSRLLSMPVDSIPDIAPLPASSIMPFGRNPLFVGRTHDLIELARALKAGRTATVTQVTTAAASGLGGIGKTQLACEFVHRYGQYFVGGVFWLNFEHADALPNEIAACGGAGAMELRQGFATLPLEERVRLVQAAWQSPTPRLLVFDNCEDPELLLKWRPTTGGCRVLVTSRRGDWDRVLNVESLPLGVLARAESIELLSHHLPDAAPTILDRIADELGDLPLALHLAGSYLDRYRRSVKPEEYLNLLLDPSLLRHPSFQGHGISPTGHTQHVGRTFALSYDRLNAADPVDETAIRLLVHAAHFAPGEPIWYDLLVQTLAVNLQDAEVRLHIDAAFLRLIELGLIELVENDRLRMHRLIALFVHDVAREQAEAARSIVEQVVFEETTRVNRAGYPLHLLAWQRHLRAVVDLSHVREDEESARLCTELGTHLYQISDYEGALPYLEKALTIRLQQLSENHLDSAKSLINMGNLLRELGDLNGARGYVQRALAVHLQLLGEKHEDTAEALNQLGRLLWLERRIDEAIPYFQRALTVALEVLNEGDPLCADYANNLALCLEEEGRFDEAKPHLEQALLIRRHALGDDHPLTAHSLNNLGYYYHRTGDLKQAVLFHQEALAARQKSLGDDHPDTAQSLLNLGRVFQELSDLELSAAYLENALGIYQRSVGNEHFRTAFCLHYLATVYEKLNKIHQARTCFDRALSIRRRMYRSEHPNIAVSLDALGLFLYSQGELGHAQTLLNEALTIREAALGDTHPLTKETQAHLRMVADARISPEL